VALRLQSFEDLLPVFILMVDFIDHRQSIFNIVVADAEHYGFLFDEKAIIEKHYYTCND